MDDASTLIVSRDTHAAALARLASTVRDPRGGVFGPRSQVWRVNREAVIFLGGGRAALLQLAHPFVARAIAEHSRAVDAPLARFVRTFERVFAMVYGDLDAALASARRVHALHETITGTLDVAAGTFASGTPYAANATDVLLWVHATLWDTSVQITELVGDGLPAETREAYYAETRRFAALFGIPDGHVPPDWRAFAAYVDARLRSSEIVVTPAARDIAHRLLRPSGTWIGPVWDWYAAVTAFLLPARLRTEFALPWNANVERVARSTFATLRTVVPWLPARVRHLPAYLDAERRCAGRGRDPLAWLLDRLAGRVRGGA